MAVFHTFSPTHAYVLFRACRHHSTKSVKWGAFDTVCPPLVCKCGGQLHPLPPPGSAAYELGLLQYTVTVEKILSTQRGGAMAPPLNTSLYQMVIGTHATVLPLPPPRRPKKLIGSGRFPQVALVGAGGGGGVRTPGPPRPAPPLSVVQIALCHCLAHFQ